MGKYLDVANRVNAKQHSAGGSTRRSTRETDVRDEKRRRGRDQSDESDRRSRRSKAETIRHATLTVREALEEINTLNTGVAIQASCYLRGEITKENAIQWVTCAIMHRWGASFEGWKRHAPAVEAALTHLKYRYRGECL